MTAANIQDTTEGVVAASNTSNGVGLTCGEVFEEPTTIGEFLPKGKRRFREWIKARAPELLAHDPKHVYENYDSDDEEYHETNNAINLEDDSGKNNSLLLLAAEDEFPFQYLVDDADSNASTQTTVGDLIDAASFEPAIQGRIKQPKKTPKLFSKCQNETIEIPSNVSGVVGISGRRIHLDRLATNDASLYSMVRAWIRDDPESQALIVPPPKQEATDVTAPRRRNTLLEYKPIMEKEQTYSMIRSWAKQNDDKSNSQPNSSPHKKKRLFKDKILTSPPPKNLSERIGNVGNEEDTDDDCVIIEVRNAVPNQVSSSIQKKTTDDTTAAQTVDVLGWLATDAQLRPVQPSYPTLEDMQRVRKQQTARRLAYQNRRKKREALRTSLRKRGFRL